MATYSSTQYTAGEPVAVHGDRNGLQMARFTVTCTAAPTTSDTINFGYVPANARLVGGYMVPSDMDTSGSPTLTLNVGDAGSATRLFSANTGGQTGTAALIGAAALDYQFTAKTLIVGTAAANATTGAAGTITLVLLYVVEE